MGYTGIWIAFLTLWFVLGTSVAVFPVAVARLLRGRRDQPSPKLLTAWRGIGAFVAVYGLVALVSIFGKSAVHPVGQ